MCNVFGEDELGGSQRSSAREEESKRGAHLVELIAEVYGVDVVALEIREHNDLDIACSETKWLEGVRAGEREEDARRRPW